MSGAVRVVLICCLLQDILCQDWTVTMPQTIEALSGSCVNIPCNFRLGSGWDTQRHVDDSCRAIWRTGWRRIQVFDSSLTGPNANLNVLQGNLTGNLRQGECTTVFNSLPSNHYDDYYFRIECNSQLKFSYRATVGITAKDSLPRPTLTPSRVEVEAGASVVLSCSAAAPCPTLPPNLTWTPRLGDSEEKLEANVATSLLNFTASPLHHGQKISCAALYNRQAGYSDLSFERSLTIGVLYPPHNTSVGPVGTVLEGDSVTLTCSSNANPAVESYTWHQANGDQLTSASLRRRFTTKVFVDNSQFYCEARNRYGTQKSPVIQIHVQFPPRNTTVSVDPPGPVLEGSSVTLTCNSTANPAVQNYTWYRVNGDAGDLLESGPTFTIESADPSHNGEYYCEAKNDHGEGKATAVQLDIHYPPKNTSVSVSPTGPVTEGSPVTLTCSSIGNPAVENYTWYRVDEGEKEAVGSDKDFTFNVTKLSTDEYYCEARNDHGSELSEPISVDATFAPEIQGSSLCVKILSQIRCSCESHGYPPPSLVWELAGQPVNHSADIPIREVPVGKAGLRSFITLRHTNQEAPTLVCLSTNSEGFDSLAFNVSAVENHLGLHTVSLLVGCAVGAMGMMVLCSLLLLITFMKRKGSLSCDRGLKETTELLVTNGVVSTKEEAVYADTATLEVDVTVEGDSLHYANVNFAQLQAKSDGMLGEGEIRGLASKTAEYAEIRLHSRPGTAGEAGDVADTAFGQEKDTDAHGAEAAEQTMAESQGNGSEPTVETTDSGHP